MSKQYRAVTTEYQKEFDMVEASSASIANQQRNKIALYKGWSRHRVVKLQKVQCRTATVMYLNGTLMSYPTQLQRYNTKSRNTC